MQELLEEKIKNIEKKFNVNIIYASIVGSKLFGTYKEDKSDLDIRFLFIPSKEDLLLKKDKNSISDNIISKDTNGKNTNEAIDFDGWSIHNFFNLLSKGETNALDLLFSMFREDTIIFKNENIINEIKNNKERLLNKNMNSFVGYSLSQIKKFGIKGERYNDLSIFYNSLIKFKDFDKNKKLKDIQIDNNNFFEVLKDIIKKNNLSHIKTVLALAPRTKKEDEQWEYISILGKLFSENISFEYFENKVKDLYKSFGNRTKTIANTKSKTDFKALSHSLRISLECKELLETHFIKFPLAYREEIKQIKFFNEEETEEENLEAFIYSKIERIQEVLGFVDILLVDSNLNEESDKKWINSFILSLYN